MDRFKLPLSDNYIDGNATSPIFKIYEPLGEYMGFRNLNVPSWKIVTLDDEGIPLNLHHGARHYNPVTIAHYALELYSILIHNGSSPEIEIKFKNVIEWCLQNQTEDGGWPFTFDHLFFKDRVALTKAPWYSALSQGMMISALTRATTKMDFNYRKSIHKSLDIITKNVNNGGVKRLVFDRYSFFEEYPTEPASYVLNGFMFCLIGLYDGHKMTGESCYKDALDDGLNTLEVLLPLYDLGNGSSYDLTHMTSKIEGPNKARNSYHRLHIQLLSTIDYITQGRFTRIVSRWDSYLRGNALITN